MFRMTLGGGAGLDAMERVLRTLVGARTFADLDLPLVVMTVDLDARGPAPFTQGPLADALMAATALPGMFPPYERSGQRLVDGLALVPVPTAAVAAEGADLTVSVNLLPRELLAAWPGEPPPDPAPERRRYRMLDTLLEVTELAQLETSVRDASLADVVVTPRFGPGGWRDFDLADRFLAAGEAAAARALPRLEALAQPVPAA
jgi:NTE family protein